MPRKQKDVTEISVALTGKVDIMFDRYMGKGKETAPPETKMYYADDGETLVFPSINVLSFLTAKNTESAPKRFLGRAGNKTADAIASYVGIEPFTIPITRDGKPIVFKGWDKTDGVYHVQSVARLKGGIPNDKDRPVIATPWEIAFTLSVYANDENVDPVLLRELFVKGGRAIGLGTYRHVYGKFAVTTWDVK